MGGNWSSLEPEPSPDLWWPAVLSSVHVTHDTVDKEEAAEVPGRRERGRVKHEELEIFKQELARKRALRHEALAALQTEMKELRNKVEEERALRLKAEEERDQLKMSSEDELRRELDTQREEKKKLFEEKERLMEEVEQKEALERQVQALKDVSEIGKEMLRIRELQVKELKKKLIEINISSVMAPPEDLRIEYEKQIENIRKLRTLYEERAAATLVEHRRELEREEARKAVLEAKLSDLQKETNEYKEKKKELEENIEKLENTIQVKEDELETAKDNLFSSTVQNQSLSSQMTLINNLFSHMLISPNVDLDRLIRLLKENHGLITDLTEKGDSNEVAALLVDLAEQVEKEHEPDENKEVSENSDEISETQSEIASNLSKVWRVMVELLSHHKNTSQNELAGGAESCYKCIETPKGPRSVISVSQTFLTLKDLILEKNRLVKEVGRLKTLNNHLEDRLGSQEKRLSVVTTELKKTWGIVNKLRAQHKQLHTHEKILRYELQQKRCMLTELKQELEHCRDKWDRARQKNTQTEEDWKKLRKEFAARKSRKESNSAESGYEEEDLAQSPPSEASNLGDDMFKIGSNVRSEPELSEEEIEHSDGNSFDTVIDLLDIACLENQTECESEVPFPLCVVTSETSDASPSLLPLTGSEFTEGLDQIESEDLAAVLDIQYQNQLLGVDYNLSLPSSSGSSPIPTENDDFASSEMDVSEEDSSSIDNHVYPSPLPPSDQLVSEETLLFGSNSSKNISKFLDGLFSDQQYSGNMSNSPPNLSLNVPSTSEIVDNDDTATPLVNNENCYQFPIDSATPLVNNEFPVNNTVLSEKIIINETNQMQPKSHKPYTNGIEHGNITHEETADDQECVASSSQSNTKSQEKILEAREEKLKKLEKQCRSLVSKVTSTSFRSEIIANKLDELHLAHCAFEEPSDIDKEIATEQGVCEQQPHNQANKYEQLKTDNSIDTFFKCTTSSENLSTQETKVVCSSDCEILPKTSCPTLRRTPEEILEARAARLRRLENQCKSLFSKMSSTSSRSDSISNKLEDLHNAYGPSGQTAEEPTSEMESLSIMQTFIPENVEHHSNEKIDKDEKRDSKPPDLASESKEILSKCSLPGPSLEPIPVTTVDHKRDRTAEEILEARAERFKRLEEQCKSLVSKMTATSLRGEIISNKLDELHSCYGSSEDVSDSEDCSSSPDRRKFTTTTLPRYGRKTARSLEKQNPVGVAESSKSEVMNDENIIKRITSVQATIQEPENIASNPENIDRLKRNPEEILQARAQRLNRLEEQCRSLFTKMSATSQRSDVISNRLEELHGQYGQAITSENCQVTASADTAPTFINTGEIRLEEECEEERRPSQCVNEAPSQAETTNNKRLQNSDKSE